MAKKVAAKKEPAKKAQKARPVKKPAVAANAARAAKKRETPVPVADTKKPPAKKIDQKAIAELLAKGKKQGYLTYDEINEMLPEDMLSPDQIDETLMLFDDNGIEVVDQMQNKKLVKTVKAVVESKLVSEDADATDYGAVTDPVKMYLREMGMVTLLSREGEVEIAKKIEAGEQEVLRALLDSTAGVEEIIRLGEKIENGTLRPKHVLRDIDEGDTYNDEVAQTGKFLETIRQIKSIHEQTRPHREKAFALDEDPEEQRNA